MILNDVILLIAFQPIASYIIYELITVSEETLSKYMDHEQHHLLSKMIEHNVKLLTKL